MNNHEIERLKLIIKALIKQNTELKTKLAILTRDLPDGEYKRKLDFFKAALERGEVIHNENKLVNF